jgi:hypothetical protein
MAASKKQNSTGTKRTGSADASSRSRTDREKRYPYYVMCVENDGYEASLDLGRAYKVIAPRANDRPDDLRVVDNEGEDYLYSAERFVEVELPIRARRAVAQAAGA